MTESEMGFILGTLKRIKMSVIAILILTAIFITTLFILKNMTIKILENYAEENRKMILGNRKLQEDILKNTETILKKSK